MHGQQNVKILRTKLHLSVVATHQGLYVSD